MPYSEQQICRGLEAGEFVPYFQPIVNLRTTDIHGFEILARWEHPTQGLIPPSVFIPLVERYTLINNLSLSLLSQAFAAMAALPGHLGLSANLSPSQLHDRTLPNLIELTAEDAGFSLNRLTVELTETALVDDLQLAGSVAEELKKLGIRLSLDDFGTGYSSLLHLQSLPFDELKVDASFVRCMVQSRQSRKITAAVVSLGSSLGLHTVAEGIEEQSQANLLAWQGCTFGQGYLYGRPAPASELSNVLSRPRPATGVTTAVPASIADPFLPLDAQPTERLSQLRAIYDSAPAGLSFISADLRYVNLNQQLAEMNGKTVHEHLGRKVSEIVAPEVYAHFEAYLKAALQGRSFAGIEVLVPPASPAAKPKTVMASYQPVQDEVGEILGVCVSIADITALKQKEDALRESEDHYRHTVELNPQIPWVMDPNGNNLSVSSRWQALTGLTAEQSRHRGWAEALHPEDKDSVLRATEQALVTGEALDLQYRVRSNGEWVWMRSRGAPRRDSHGRIIRWYGSVESIDEHKRAVDELRCSEARLRAIFKATPVGVVLVEASSHRVLNANPRAEQLIGFRFASGMLWTADGWVAFDSRGRTIQPSHMPLTRALRTGEAMESEEMLLRRPDGSRVWLSVTAAPVRRDNGALLGAVLVVQDIDANTRERQRIFELSSELTPVLSRDSARPSQEKWIG